MTHVVHVTGARPNFPKAAPVIEALRRRGVSQKLVHTGQHYDRALSDVFFEQLGLPRPDLNLGVGSGSHAQQTAAVMVAMEELLQAERPDVVVVYGDVNSTVATALVAAKLGIPLAHVEAGLRSFDRAMPEEVNRIVTDSLSTLLFTTSPEANTHLGHEGIPADKVHFVGNPMIDTLLRHLDQFRPDIVQESLGLAPGYTVATIHRPSNVDDPVQAKRVVNALHSVADLSPVVVPIHPRGRERLAAAGLEEHRNMRVVEPLAYVEFMGLIRGSDAVITDSGGVQEETTILGVPCLTLRENTERPITISHGTNQLVSPELLAKTFALVKDQAALKSQSGLDTSRVPPLWDGRAGERIAQVIERALAGA